MKKQTLKLPVFPLNGAILFPGANLPLNVFEERYLEMVDYAMSSDRKIGMIQEIEKTKKLYEIGCIGKITNFSETKDNRYIINLEGISHFKKIKEIETQKIFRILLVEYDDDSIFNIGKHKFNKDVLFDKFKLFLEKQYNENNFSGIEKIESNELIKFIAMASPFNVPEKQMLLESKNISDLEEKLIGLFDFYNNQYQEKNTIN